MTVKSLRRKIHTNLWRFTTSEIFYYTALSVIGLLLLFLIVLTKSKTAASIDTEPMLLVYPILVTTFELSRIVAAMLYSNTVHIHKMHPDLKAQTHNYEPLVSFVVPCYNEGPAIEKTITKCFDADYPKEKLEVIVINDWSTDNTR